MGYDANRPPSATATIRPCAKRLFQLLALGLPMLTASGEAPLDDGWRVGFRGGFSEGGGVKQAELAAHHRLPWAWSLGHGCSLKTEFDVAIGGIKDARHTASVASLGPSLRLTIDKIPVSLVGGSAPTIIGRSRLGGENLGTAFQFTSHIGLSWHITGRFEAGYRFQHMSNAGLNSHNPGLDLHMAALTWRF